MDTHYRYPRVDNPRLVESDRIISIEHTDDCASSDGVSPATYVRLVSANGRYVSICSGCPATDGSAVYETRISADDIVRIGPSDCAKEAVEVTVRNEYFPHQSGYRYWTTCSYCVTHPNYRDGGHN